MNDMKKNYTIGTRAKRGLAFLVFFICVFYSSDTQAAHVGNPMRIFSANDSEEKVSFFTESVADYTYDRRAKHQLDDAEIDFYAQGLGIVLHDRIAFYGGAGLGSLKEEFDANGVFVRWESDHGFAWFAGSTIKLYEGTLKSLDSAAFLLVLDGQYRNTDLDPDLIRIGQTEYAIPDPAISHSSMEYNDWHLALSFAIQIDPFQPYIGLKYSDFESTVRVTRNATVYQKDNAEADNNFGIFIGTGIKVTESLNAHVEASFFDEDSLSAGITFKF